MDKRITFGELKKAIYFIQSEWKADDDVIVFYDQSIADSIQELKNNAMYLDWVNNFLTVARFAEYYGLTEAQAIKLIETERAKQ